MQSPLPHTHWRHCKSTGGIDHTYEVVGTARHSETGEDMVVYRPLYIPSAGSWVHGYDYAVRPLHMWHETVVHSGQQVQRFTQIDI